MSGGGGGGGGDKPMPSWRKRMLEREQEQRAREEKERAAKEAKLAELLRDKPSPGHVQKDYLTSLATLHARGSGWLDGDVAREKMEARKAKAAARLKTA
eukprot:CAMPEP_0198339098 /NCGR_PEP_ID=MMETSP1450-20131203/37718_1 /TAXON_ID=753684 ORGANISM="Madagascaria erythrocladiodes, Strain CCMP3234" /NCGR_SAMPLE_ID=MMETSP1450 /ASSEMBLY_ACC=CAM_ASM_001115 /LENGTH=98 /DNA_ID=CAMNT_0044043999 /DNA_START=54 /DNA_END=346 /DNA_ORIENTATION=-